MENSLRGNFSFCAKVLKNSWNHECEKYFNHLSKFDSKIKNQENSSKFEPISMDYYSRIQGLPRIQAEPVPMTCPSCHLDIITHPQRGCYDARIRTQFQQRILDFFFVFCFWGCCWIPGWNDKIHFCPSCQRPIGIYKNGR